LRWTVKRPATFPHDLTSYPTRWRSFV